MNKDIAKTDQNLNLSEIAADVVAAYVSNNSVPVTELTALIRSVYSAIAKITGAEPVEKIVEPPRAAAAVQVKKSVTPEFIVCLEDGNKFKSLRRHLKASHDLTPEQYRTKWNLPGDYPMVAPVYAVRRSELAKDIGLGRHAGERPKKPARPK